MGCYILGLDQSTQGTKAILFDASGKIARYATRPHKQIINEQGWVEHDPDEIYQNILQTVKDLLIKADTGGDKIIAAGISNQRETILAWRRTTGIPIHNAIVWQCARATQICKKLEQQNTGDFIKERTGLNLSPYFSAAKAAWILQNVPSAKKLMQKNDLCIGTIDSWLVYKLTDGKVFKTDFSNASRTQLFNIKTLKWDTDICSLFGISPLALPEVCDSNALYGTTTFFGILTAAIPIHAVLGDSQAALYGQGCHSSGMLKATYGTGSSVMMNTGTKTITSKNGLVNSLAWSIDGNVNYVLEGNINYTGASISWLKDNLQIIDNAAETADIAKNAHPKDKTYFVPAFTGLGAPYWDTLATGLFTGITRITGKNEIVRAVLDSISYQINDVVKLMQRESDLHVKGLCADGGVTKNSYLMQFQADIFGLPVKVSSISELSAAGAAYVTGITTGFYDKGTLFSQLSHQSFFSKISADKRSELVQGWQNAIARTIVVK